jgi:fibronectin-binding autotransporter adhesin
MSKQVRRMNRKVAVSLAVAATALPGLAGAGTITHNANSNNLNDPAAWVGDIVPGSGDIALWDATSASGDTTAALGADLSWLGIQITNPAATVTINGNNTLTIGGGGIDLSAATQDLTISANFALLGNTTQTWNVAPGRTLSLNTGTFTRNAGATLTLTGAGTFAASNIANVNGIVGPWAVVNNAGAYSYATVNGSGDLVAYTGATQESNASTAWAGIPSGGTGTVNYDITASGTFGTTGLMRNVNTIRYLGSGAATQNSNTGNTTGVNVLTLNGFMNDGGGTFTIGTPPGQTGGLNVTIGATRELVLAPMTAGIVFNGVIVDNSAGASGVTVFGNSFVTLAGANTYTGPTVVDSGTLIATNASSLVKSSGTTVAAPGTLDVRANIGAEPITLAGSLITGTGSGTAGGPITLTGNASVGGAGTLTVSGAIGGSFGLNKVGAGTTNLSGASTYTGLTTVSAGILNVTGSLASPLTIQSGGTFTGSGNGSTTGIVSGAVTLNGGGAIDFSKDGLTAPTALTVGNGLSIGSNSGPAASLTYNINNTATDLISLTGGNLNAFAAGGTPNVINLNALGTLTGGSNTFNLITFPSGQTNLTNGNVNSLFTIGTRPTGLITFTLGVTNTALQLTESATPAPITAYWTGKDDNTWSDFTTSPVVTNFSSTADGNTDAGQLPSVNSDVVFTAASNGKGTSLSGAAISTTLGSNFTIDSLTFNATTASVMIGGTNTLTLNATGSSAGTGSLGYAAGTGIVVQSGAGPVTIGTTSLALGGPQTWSNASGNALTIAAPITGTSALTINNTGSGATVLSAANTFSGGLTLSQGLLQPSGSGTLGATNGTLTVNGGTLDLNGTSQSVGNFTGAGGTVLNNGSAAATFTVGTGNGTGGNYAGAIADNNNGGAGTLALVKTGTGAITLSGMNTYSGGTTINGGTLQFPTAAVLPQFGTAGKVAANSGGTLAINYGGASDWNSTQVSTLLANLASNGGAIAFDTTHGSGTYANAITDTSAGALGVTKLGPNALTLSGASTYSGVTTISNGTLNVTGSIVQATPNSLALATAAGNNAVLDIGGDLTVLNMAVGGGGTGTAGTGGAGAIYQTAGTVTLTDTTTGSGTAGPDRIFSLGGSGSQGTNGYGYYNLSGSGSVSSKQFSIGARSTGAVGVMDVAGGTMTASSLINVGRGNAATGGVTGVLDVTGGTVSSPLVQMGFVPGGVSVLNVGGGTGPASLAEAGSATAGGIDLANATASATAVVNLLPNGTATVPRVFATTASAAGTFLNFNGGTLQAAPTNFGGSFLNTANIAAVNVYAGGGTIDNNGTGITIGNILAAPAGSGVASAALSNGGSGYVGAPAVVITDSGNTGVGATGHATLNPATGAVTGVTITSPGTGFTGSPVFTFLGGGGNGAAASGTTGANVSGGMTFQGAGTTILTAANTWTGNTTVSAGTLEVDGSLANTPVTVASGATLAGKGTINNTGANAVTVNGTVAPGTASSTANLTTGPQAWSAGGSYTWKLNTNNATSNATASGGTTDPGGAGANWDMVSVSTLNVASSGSFTINLTPFSGSGSNAFNAQSPYTWSIADISTGQGNYASLLAHLQLNAAPLATATSTPANDYSLGLISDGGSGQDLVVNYSPAPEPTSMALLGLGAGGLLLRRRRRASSDRMGLTQ